MWIEVKRIIPKVYCNLRQDPTFNIHKAHKHTHTIGLQYGATSSHAARKKSCRNFVFLHVQHLQHSVRGWEGSLIKNNNNSTHNNQHSSIVKGAPTRVSSWGTIILSPLPKPPKSTKIFCHKIFETTNLSTNHQPHSTTSSVVSSTPRLIVVLRDKSHPHSSQVLRPSLSGKSESRIGVGVSFVLPEFGKEKVTEQRLLGCG
jgi:hypothetical protein